ncbi:MAG: hypothetical protein MJZ28_01240 [Paludibacteraceae bacterium]|nr:hypothetical protein [Paludibacteraceae bacterium]
MNHDNVKVQAIIDTDLEKLLAQSNQLDDFIEGKIICPVCGTVITEDNIGILYPIEHSGKIIFEMHCNNSNCLSK